MGIGFGGERRPADRHAAGETAGGGSGRGKKGASPRGSKAGPEEKHRARLCRGKAVPEIAEEPGQREERFAKKAPTPRPGQRGAAGWSCEKGIGLRKFVGHLVDWRNVNAEFGATFGHEIAAWKARDRVPGREQNCRCAPFTGRDTQGVIDKGRSRFLEVARANPVSARWSRPASG